ncbi:helix-turn-helix domain-containing protein [Hymenobacter terrenus]|uniref:helix-turn-helix domain-containing protein n=1 Tax=Hymenobacter terrenus TaxID=1629124 RepID=UPI000695E749|nr:helix-turn-helix transcriptional regulator [Hymenobacter terrenus]
MNSTAIPTYSTEGYLRKFLPEPAGLQQLLVAEAAQFFIVPVEQMYPLFRQALPPARATGHTCLYLTTGTARMNIGTESYTIGPHEALLVRAGQVYSFQPGDVNTGFLCHFRDDVLLGSTGNNEAAPFDFLRFWGQPVIQLDAETGQFAEQLLRRLLAEYGTHQLRYLDLVRAYLLALLHELNRAYVASAPAPLTTAVALTNRFKQLVATSLATTHRVSDYADQLHITPNHLSKCVRSVTGKSPARWIEESIVLEAKVLLFQSKWSVGDIALAVGVADASYFSRLFKKHAGVTPLGFRKGIELS